MAPPADIPNVPGFGVPAPSPAAPAPPETPQGGRPPALPAPPALDRADIRPLDVSGGLQILIAEVRAALEEALLQALTPGKVSTPVASPALQGPAGLLLAEGVLFDVLPTAAPEAARQLVDLFLKLLPAESADDAALAQRLPALDSAIQSAGVRALAIVDAWRNVPVTTQDAAHQALQLVANALGEESLQAAWLRPEWAGVLPRLERFRRRRRRLKRRLEDPDYPGGRLADDEQR